MMNQKLFIEVMVLACMLYSANAYARSTSVDVALSSTYRTPLHSENWSPYVSCGVSIGMPTYVPGISIEPGFELGVIKHAKRKISAECIHLRNAIKFDTLFIVKSFSLNPYIGLSSMMVGNARDGEIDIFHQYIFSTVENEYGLFAGVSPKFAFGKMIVGLPVEVESVLSSPRKFVLLNIALKIGFGL